MVDLETIKKKWRDKTEKSKTYLHFDCRKNSQTEKIQKYITNPKKIASHSFYPFLHNTIIIKKFNKADPNKPKEKKREINYSAHIDRLIFAYYSQILNSKYNDYLIEKNINNNVIAYRNNLKKNNIHFAKSAFDFIRKFESSFIVIGDFSNFFDNLEHDYLKNKICEVLNIPFLPDDWYAIYKNITKFSFCELNDVREFSKEEKIKKTRYFSPKLFRELRKNKLLKIKKNLKKGIPQGSAISAVLANVYMIDFDCKLKQFVESFGGEYFRYSDDFILIFPMKVNENINFIIKKIQEIKKEIPNLELQEEKTQCFYYAKNKITNLNEKNKIGYCFDKTYVYYKDKEKALKNYSLYKGIMRNINCKNKIKNKKVAQIRQEYKKYIKHLNYYKTIKKLLNDTDGHREKAHCIYQNLIIGLLDEKIRTKNLISYLGFSFDGKNITIRDKTLSKYYNRMYKKIKTINKNNRVTKKGNIISCRELYSKYSAKGNRNKKDVEEGNFIGYVERAMKIFTKKDDKNIACVKNRNYKKIKDKLIKVDEDLMKRKIRARKAILNKELYRK